MTSQPRPDGRGITRRRFLEVGAVTGVAIWVPSTLARSARAAQSPDKYVLTAQALGVNTTSGDRNFTDAPVADLLRQAGIGRVRYPGGGGADSYDWQSTTSALPWPAFMNQLAQIGAAPMITVNYGQLSQGPAAAAAWVTSALTFSNYSSETAVWVLGNEEYGPWENDQHPNPHTPASFATYVRPYFESMHAVDPSTRVGFPMTIARQVAGGTGTWVADPDLWNRTVLRSNVDQVDFIDFHWYPIFGIPVLSNAELFETVERIPGAVSYLRGILADYRSDAPIVVSESNISQSEIVYNAQPVAALYAAATAMKFLSQGTESYMWWQVHNSDNLDGDFGFLSNATGSPGPVATTLVAAARVGDQNLSVASADGFYYAHRFTIGSGSAQESRKITALPGATTLAAPAGAGDRNVKIAATSTITTSGSTTAYQQFFAPGTPVTIGSGAAAESHIVASVGTAASSAALAAPAAAGDTNVKIVGVGMGGQSIPVFMPTGFAPGATITIGSGADAEVGEVTAVGTSSSLGTTTVASAGAGDATIYVASVANTNTGIANYVGDLITIDTGAAEEVRIIKAVGASAATPTELVAPAAAGARTVYLASVNGVTPGHPLLVGSGDDTELVSTITAVGAQTATTLAAAADAGSTMLTLTSVAGFVVGDLVTVGTATAMQTATITQIGSSGLTLNSPLVAAQASGAPVVDVGSGVTLSTPLGSAHAAGEPAQDVGSGITLTTPLDSAHAAGVPTRDAGTGLTLAAPLGSAHPDGSPATTPGTGVNLTTRLGQSHAVGEAMTSNGITFTPALSRRHASGASVGEMGLQEPPLDTPLPAYWGFVLAHKLAQPGAAVAELASPTSTVLAYSSIQAGNLSVMLINTDDTAPATLSLKGFFARGTNARAAAKQRKMSLQTFAYGLETPSLVEGTTTLSPGNEKVTLSPESLMVLVASFDGTAPELSLSR